MPSAECKSGEQETKAEFKLSTLNRDMSCKLQVQNYKSEDEKNAFIARWNAFDPEKDKQLTSDLAINYHVAYRLDIAESFLTLQRELETINDTLEKQAPQHELTVTKIKESAEQIKRHINAGFLQKYLPEIEDTLRKLSQDVDYDIDTMAVIDDRAILDKLSNIEQKHIPKLNALIKNIDPRALEVSRFELDHPGFPYYLGSQPPAVLGAPRPLKADWTPLTTEKRSKTLQESLRDFSETEKENKTLQESLTDFLKQEEDYVKIVQAEKHFNFLQERLSALGDGKELQQPLAQAKEQIRIMQQYLEKREKEIRQVDKCLDVIPAEAEAKSLDDLPLITTQQQSERDKMLASFSIQACIKNIKQNSQRITAQCADLGSSLTKKPDHVHKLVSSVKWLEEFNINNIKAKIPSYQSKKAKRDKKYKGIGRTPQLPSPNSSFSKGSIGIALGVIGICVGSIFTGGLLALAALGGLLLVGSFFWFQTAARRLERKRNLQIHKDPGLQAVLIEQNELLKTGEGMRTRYEPEFHPPMGRWRGRPYKHQKYEISTPEPSSGIFTSSIYRIHRMLLMKYGIVLQDDVVRYRHEYDEKNQAMYKNLNFPGKLPTNEELIPGKVEGNSEFSKARVFWNKRTHTACIVDAKGNETELSITPEVCEEQLRQSCRLAGG